MNGFYSYAALCGVVMYNYLKVKDVRAAQLSSETLPERIVKVSFILSPDWIHFLVCFNKHWGDATKCCSLICADREDEFLFLSFV